MARVALVMGAWLLAPGSPAHAAPKDTYVYLVSKVDFKVEVPAYVDTLTKDALSKVIKANERLTDELPEGAPDPDKEPKKFKAFMKQRRHRAYRVNVEITEHEETVAPAREGRGKIVTVKVALRVFGETIPDRTMAFSGDGSAGVAIGTGSHPRDRDRQVANRDAIELAITQAIETSIERLDEKKPKQR